MDVEFRILRPLEVWAGGSLVKLRGPRQERCLAALLLEPRRLVTLDLLIDAVWDGRPPSTARRQVQDLVSGLRRTLVDRTGRTQLITTGRTGYVLHVDPAELDALRFEQLVTAGRDDAAADPRGSAAALRSALTLFRGATLAGISSRALQPATARWEELRLTVWEDWLALEVELGNHGVALGELRGLVDQHPLRERPVQLLMRTLYATGRPAEALDVYRQFRARLADEVGLDPSPDLQELQRAILAGDTDVARPPAAANQATLSAALAPATPVPAHLPPDVRGFAGRVRELEVLDAAAFDRGEQPTAVVIAAVAGTAGIGKTALAVHWAHRVADHFPDGQLYVNLRGFDPSGVVMDPADAVRILLEELRVPVSLIPTTLEAQVGLYRSLLADKRMLVVLDNARDADQVRPLLPGAPGCVAVVTSRDQLTSLVAVEGAHRITLDLLTDVEARHLLARRLGRQAVEAEAEAVDDIIESCERLPLALAIVAAHAAGRPDFRIADLADQLRRTRGSLDAFSVGDPRLDLRAVYSWSYTSLSPAAARMFRLLGLHAGPDFSVPAAASLAGVPVDRARRALAELTRANLVVSQRFGRFTLHDLLWAYATELVHDVDSAAGRAAAQRRLLDHYLHTAYAAAMLLRPGRALANLADRSAGVVPEELTSRDKAQAWFAAERDVLVACVRRAAQQGYATHAWQLVWALGDILEWRGHWRELVAAARVALEATVARGDREGQAETHNEMARALWRLGEHDLAHAHVERAAALFGEIGDRARQSVMLRNMGTLYYQQGRNQEALACTERAIELMPADIRTAERAYMLNALGWLHAQLGNYELARTYCEQALAVQEMVDDATFMGVILDSLGYIHHHLGHHDEAIAWYERALGSHRGAQEVYRARTLVRLGDVQQAAGMPEAAASTWRQALDLFSRVDPASADSVRERLRTVDTSAERTADRTTDGGSRQRLQSVQST
jgi:DNA-binding SARP family transcriptional activator/tetratricopeptide (TPR) repeat protein